MLGIVKKNIQAVKWAVWKRIQAENLVPSIDPVTKRETIRKHVSKQIIFNWPSPTSKFPSQGKNNNNIQISSKRHQGGVKGRCNFSKSLKTTLQNELLQKWTIGLNGPYNTKGRGGNRTKRSKRTVILFQWGPPQKTLSVTWMLIRLTAHRVSTTQLGGLISRDNRIILGNNRL